MSYEDRRDAARLRLLFEALNRIAIEWGARYNLDFDEAARADLVGELVGTQLGMMDAGVQKRSGKTWLQLYEDLAKEEAP